MHIVPRLAKESLAIGTFIRVALQTQIEPRRQQKNHATLMCRLMHEVSCTDADECANIEFGGYGRGETLTGKCRSGASLIKNAFLLFV